MTNEESGKDDHGNETAVHVFSRTPECIHFDAEYVRSCDVHLVTTS